MQDQLSIFMNLLRPAGLAAVRDARGCSFLHEAAQGGDLLQAEWLAARGADIHVTDRDGLTPLHLAARHGHIDLADFFLERGAQPSSRTGRGRTPLLLAVMGGHHAVARRLIDAGACPDTADDFGFVPLHLAAFRNDCRMIGILRLAGASLALSTGRGSSASDISRRHGCAMASSVLERLKAHVPSC